MIYDMGYNAYLEYRDILLKLLPAPKMVVWLEARPETCLSRIDNRNRGCESGISLDYLYALRDSYDPILAEFRKLGTEVIICDWDTIKPPEYVLDLISTNTGMFREQWQYRHQGRSRY
jgi:deoxyadenosine/deoxycytidine kinase